MPPVNFINSGPVTSHSRSSSNSPSESQPSTTAQERQRIRRCLDGCLNCRKRNKGCKDCKNPNITDACEDCSKFRMDCLHYPGPLPVWLQNSSDRGELFETEMKLWINGARRRGNSKEVLMLTKYRDPNLSRDLSITERAELEARKSEWASVRRAPPAPRTSGASAEDDSRRASSSTSHPSTGSSRASRVSRPRTVDSAPSSRRKSKTTPIPGSGVFYSTNNSQPVETPSSSQTRSPIARLLGLGRSSSERSATPHSRAGSPGTQTQTVTVASRSATPPRSQTPHQSSLPVPPPVTQQHQQYLHPNVVFPPATYNDAELYPAPDSLRPALRVSTSTRAHHPSEAVYATPGYTTMASAPVPPSMSRYPSVQTGRRAPDNVPVYGMQYASAPPTYAQGYIYNTPVGYPTGSPTAVRANSGW